MISNATSPWSITAGDFPKCGSLHDQIVFLIGYAILAPSGHNTQPWLFRVSDVFVDVIADRTRALPVVDPHDRALEISCGAAIGLLEVAARRFGLKTSLSISPDSNDPDLLARIHFAPGAAPTADDVTLFKAIPSRRTDRTAFSMDDVPVDFTSGCAKIARETDIEIKLLAEIEDRVELAVLVAEGDRRQFEDPCFRRELAAWIHSKRLDSRDGMSGACLGLPDLLSGVGSLVIRTFDMGDGIAAADEAKILSGTPALLVFGSVDTTSGWINTGRALGRVTLLATSLGLSTSYLNQPVEIDALRPEIKFVAGLDSQPQLLLRVGRSETTLAPTARRDVSEVILKDG